MKQGDMHYLHTAVVALWVWALSAVLYAVAVGAAGPVDSGALIATPRNAGEWLHYGGNYAGWRHSRTTAFTPRNVSQLRVAWAFQTGVAGQLEANPIVYDGTLYLTSSRNRIFALDAVTGALLWRYDHPLPDDLILCCGPANRGVAIAGDRIFMGTLDARIVALDRRTGALIWNSLIENYRDGFSATSAPLVVKDMVIIGIGGGEFGVRGFFDAFELASGKRRWRHYTVPDTGEPGSESWAGDSYKTGGGSSWSIGAYDPDSDTLFWPVGNPAPDFNGEVRIGDNLFTNSILALDPNSGKRKWHFQATPHDVWDYDGNSEIWLVDVERDGKFIPAVVQANRNGYVYVLERATGKFLRATAYVEQLNWADIDEKGRPVVDPRMVPSAPGEPLQRICPGIAGGNNAAYAGAYSPLTRLIYIPTIESCSTITRAEALFVKGIPFFGGGFEFPDKDASTAYGHLSAVNIDTGAVQWRYKDPFPIMAGALSTAGGVLFTGNAEGFALALDASTGEELWRFRTGSGIRSQPAAYEIDGKAFLAVGSGGGGLVAQLVGEPPSLPYGSTLFVFSLP